MTPTTADTLEIPSDLLGTLQLPAEELLAFPTGIPGFPEARRFALVPSGREGLCWLQSAELSGLVFLLADPFHWFPAYAVDVPAAEQEILGSRSPEEVAVFAIVTLPGGPDEQASANLRAPVLVNMATRTGFQVVLPEDRWAVREPLALG